MDTVLMQGKIDPPVIVRAKIIRNEINGTPGTRRARPKGI